MQIGEIISIISLCLSFVLFCTSIIVFARNTRDRIAREGEQTARREVVLVNSVDYIKSQNEALLASNREICGKLERQNDRLNIMEQTIKSAHIEDLPSDIARLDESLKSAHKRIAELTSEMKLIKGVTK